MAHTCPVCDYEFDMNTPGVSVEEAPFFTHDPEHQSTRYICSTVCMAEYLDEQDFTEPRGPTPPRY